MSSPSTSFGLLERARRGDQAAFELLFERYRRRIAVLLYYRLPAGSRRPEDIDDALQDVFAEAFAAIGDFDYRGQGSFFAWLCRIASRAAVDRAKYEGRARRKHEQVPIDSRAPEPADSRTPSRLFASKQAVGNLLERLDRLPPDYRDAIVLTKIEGLSTSEMAARLERSPDAAAVLLHRALVRFRALTRE